MSSTPPPPPPDEERPFWEGVMEPGDVQRSSTPQSLSELYGDQTVPGPKSQPIFGNFGEDSHGRDVVSEEIEGAVATEMLGDSSRDPLFETNNTMRGERALEVSNYHMWAVPNSIADEDAPESVLEADIALRETISDAIRALNPFNPDPDTSSVKPLSGPAPHIPKVGPEIKTLQSQLDTMFHPVLNAAQAHRSSQHNFQPEFSKNISVSNNEFHMPANSPLWSHYVQEAETQDQEQLLNWNTTMDNHLVFAALFSAILTAFIIEVYKLLQPDPQDLTIQLLRNINISLQGNLSSTPASLPVPAVQFSPSLGFLWVNGLWFASLLCSLGTAVTIILVKQWLQFYSLKLWSGSDYEYTKRRQQRYNSLKQWHVPTIISTLPLLLHISLLLFALGLAVMLHQINSIIANIVTGLVACLLILNGISLVLPLLYKDCPYESSASMLLERILMFTIIQAKVVKHWSMSMASYAVYHYKLKQGGKLPLSYDQHSPTSPGVNFLQTRPLAKYNYGALGAALQENSAKLSEDSILWLAQTSQSKDRIKSSLEHIRYLEHSPSLIDNLLSYNIISELTKTIYVPLPPREQFFGKYIAFNGDHLLRTTSTVEDALPCMLSLLWVWEHPKYFSDFPPPAVSLEYMQSPPIHSWLLGDWILVWRLLQQECNSNFLILESQGWNLEVFAAIVCIEVLFYQKHVKHQTLPLLDKPLKLTNIEDPDPFYDLYKIIEGFHVQNLHTHKEIMRWIFSALKQVLFSLDTTSGANTEFTQSTLLLLLSFWEKHIMQQAALNELMCCINLLISQPGEDRLKYLSLKIKNEDLSLVPATFRRVIDNQVAIIQGDQVAQEKIIAIASWGIFKAMFQKPQLTEAEMILINLPVRFSHSTINKIVALADYQWDSISQMDRHADFLISWIKQAKLPNEANWSLFFCLQDLLTSPVLRNQPSATSVIKRVLNFLQEVSFSEHQETSVYILHNILEYAIHTQDNDLVKHFLQVDAASKIGFLLESDTLSSVMHKVWKSLIRRLKSSLRKKNNNLSKDNYKLFKQLLTELSEVEHVPGQHANVPDITNPKVVESPPLVAASSPDGRMGAEGREDGIIHIYDLVTVKYLSGIPYHRHSKTIEHIAFSFNGEYIASASDDSTICIWDIKGSSLMQKLVAHGNGIMTILFSPSDKLLLTVLQDASIKILNIQTGLQASITTGHTGGIIDVNFSPDESKIVTGSYDHSIAVWNVKTGAPVTGKMLGHSEFISTVVFIDDDNLLSSAWDNKVCIWSIPRRGQIARWTNSINYLERAPNISLALQAVSSDGLITASAWQNYVICTWKLSGAGSRKKRNYGGSLQPVTAIVFSPDNKFIACGAEDGTVHIWSVESEAKALQKIKTHHKVVSLAYSQDGTFIACGLSNGTIRFWNAISGTLVAGRPEVVIGPNNSVLALSIDAQHIATGSTEGALNVWNTSTGAQLWGPQHIHTALISYITFSTDGHYILTAAHDNSVCVWNAYDGRHLKKVKNVSSKTILQHRSQIT